MKEATLGRQQYHKHRGHTGSKHKLASSANPCLASPFSASLSFLLSRLEVPLPFRIPGLGGQDSWLGSHAPAWSWAAGRERASAGAAAGSIPSPSHASADGVALWQPAPMLPSETSLSKQARGADGLSVSSAVNVSARGYKSKLL